MTSLFAKLFGGHGSMVTLTAGATAPDFRLPTLDGQEFALSQALKKGPVVLAFFKVSCPVCQYAFPYFERMYQANRNANATVIGISQDDRKKTGAFLKQFGISFPVALDDTESYGVSNAYGLTNVPTLFYIDPSGDIEVSSVSWSKADVEATNAKLASLRSESAPTLWHEGEDVREHRAG
jgi:peroxiredoxin